MKKIIMGALFISLLMGMQYAQGNWEFDLHISTWNINILKPLIEDSISPDFDNYDPDKGQFSFDSNGSSYGIAIRYFPKGKNGSFSLGFSYERNNFIL